ncbi:MAG: helix-turn-helix domain-containing protein [Holosporaceae bacterium]|jgi:transcriptional regulator with XRE-family HTH domain|nr:helix-turn-helix domain-containing protein [Holosporaceae bacterium]
MADYSVLKTKSFRNSLDLYIGKRVKARRFSLGISQEKLGGYLDITFQQVQKYEKGINRISASTLYNIANILGVELSYFVEGYQQQPSALGEGSKPTYELDQFPKKETAELLRFFYKIPDPSVRKKIMDLVKAIASTQKND